jgi:hypothetical protein
MQIVIWGFHGRDHNLLYTFSERVIVVYRQLSNFSAISWQEQVNFQ